MIQRLGTNGIRPLVLLDLGGEELVTLARVLDLAEEHARGLAALPALQEQLKMAAEMIADLRIAAGLPTARKPGNGKVS